MTKQIEVVIAEATPLDPKKAYFIVLDGAAVTKEDAMHVAGALLDQGIKHTVVLITDGDPATSVQIVEGVPEVA